MTSARQPMRIGVVGCGDISKQYFGTLAEFDGVAVTAVADLDAGKAHAASERWCVGRVLEPSALCADPDIDIVLNLTVPRAHHEVAMRAIAGTKHVYNEKPLTESVAQARELLAAAVERGVRVGCAPDTVLGTGWRFARELIDRGELGDIVGGQLNMICAGHESWHPSPEFYYEPGGGPVLDMGPYFLHALVTLLGPIAEVTARGRRAFDERVITSEPKRGTRVPVEVDTHVVAIIETDAGPQLTMTMSFDTPATAAPDMELFGTHATLRMHTPNDFGPAPLGGGVIEIKRKGDDAWHTLDPGPGPAINGRGLGVAEMAQAIAENRPHRASGELALHALEVMHAVGLSSETRRGISIGSRPSRPDPLPVGWHV